MKRNILWVLGLLACSTVFALLYKWLTTGQAFQASTLLLGCVVMLTCLSSFGLGKVFFRHFFTQTKEQQKKRIIPAFILFMLLAGLLSAAVIAFCLYAYHLLLGLDTDTLPAQLFRLEYPGAIKYFLIFALMGASFFFYSLWRGKQEAALNNTAEQIKERFLVKIGAHYKSVPIADIRGFYIQDRCPYLLENTGKSYPLEYSLDKIEKMLDPSLFFRANRNAIIHFHAIKDLRAFSSHRLMIRLIPGPQGVASQNPLYSDGIIVSRERVAACKAWLDR
jgi:Response regulator of the LytR/AlgR family